MLTRDLFSAIMATTVFSLICALIFLLLDGIDVSLTEAAVGAGISTILFLSTLKHTNVEIKASRKSSIQCPMWQSRGGTAMEVSLECFRPLIA